MGEVVGDVVLLIGDGVLLGEAVLGEGVVGEDVGGDVIVPQVAGRSVCVKSPRHS